QVDRPAFFSHIVRPRARAALQHDLHPVASEDREGVGRIVRKRIWLEPEHRHVPVDAPADVGHLKNGDGTLEAHGYSRSSVLRGNISAGVPARGRIFWSRANWMIASSALRFLATPYGSGSSPTMLRRWAMA